MRHLTALIFIRSCKVLCVMYTRWYENKGYHLKFLWMYLKENDKINENLKGNQGNQNSYKRKMAEILEFTGISAIFLLPAMGLEPIRGCPQQILSLPRLPFRHAGVPNNELYDSIIMKK